MSAQVSMVFAVRLKATRTALCFETLLEAIRYKIGTLKIQNRAHGVCGEIVL